MPSSGLKSYKFVSETTDGDREDRIFYAESRQKATDMALRWGRRMNLKMYRVRRKRGI